MENLINVVDQLKTDLKSAEDILKEVVFKIKNEMKDKYFDLNNNYSDIFRFALLLVFGVYSDKYESEVVRNIKIYPVKDFDSKEYLNHFNLYKVTSRNYGVPESYNIAGFVCYLKDLHCAINSNQFIKLWLYHINNNNYKDSLETFKLQCQSNEIDLYDLLHCSIDENDFLTIVNHKETNVKDVVIFIED